MTLQIGDLVPDIDLIDHTGTRWSIADHRDKPLVLILHRHLA